MAAVIDYEAFSRRTLKARWDGLAAADRARFVTAFRGLIISTYARRFKPGTTFRVTIRGETRWSGEGERKGTVRTTIHGARAAADVDYLPFPDVKKAHIQTTDDL